ncbi:MAG: hypothetical protein ACM3Q2_18510 [Syntrophothermus sp.]
MKKTAVFFILILLGLSACSKKSEKKLEAFSPEAFAYSLDGGWEVNATVMVKGYEMKADQKQDNIKLAYSVDLITPENRTLKGVFADTLNNSSDEAFSDLKLESQFQMDSVYKTGKYKIQINVKDLLSGKEANASREFDVSR